MRPAWLRGERPGCGDGRATPSASLHGPRRLRRRSSAATITRLPVQSARPVPHLHAVAGSRPPRLHLRRLGERHGGRLIGKRRVDPTPPSHPFDAAPFGAALHAGSKHRSRGLALAIVAVVVAVLVVHTLVSGQRSPAARSRSPRADAAGSSSSSIRGRPWHPGPGGACRPIPCMRMNPRQLEP